MNETEQAKKIANDWLDFKMNPLVQMVHGAPDCDACVLARQFLRAMEKIEGNPIKCKTCGGSRRVKCRNEAERRQWVANVKPCPDCR